MSLVDPRRHALAHDDENKKNSSPVMPCSRKGKLGIAGWAK
jgi:hypothetical protein